MRKINYVGIAFFALLALAALGCSLFSGEALQSTPTTAPAAEIGVGDGDEPPGEAASGDTSEAPADGMPSLGSLTDNLEQYNSYRVNVEMNFEGVGDSADSGTMNFETRKILNPPASSVVIHFSGRFAEDMEGLSEASTISFTEVDGTTYTEFPGMGCIAGSGNEASTDDFTAMFDMQEFLGEVRGAEYVGEDSVNDQAVHHYRFDQNDVPDADQNLRQLQGDIYVLKEENYVVRLVIEGVGSADPFGGETTEEGTLRMEYNVLDVGESFTIEPPAACQEVSAAYPVFEGATDLSSFAGLTTYTVDAPLEEVVAFYESEMAARDYTMAEDPVLLEEMAILSFSSSEQPAVTVTITRAEDAISVLISADESAQ